MANRINVKMYFIGIVLFLLHKSNYLDGSQWVNLYNIQVNMSTGIIRNMNDKFKPGNGLPSDPRLKFVIHGILSYTQHGK